MRKHRTGSSSSMIGVSHPPVRRFYVNGPFGQIHGRIAQPPTTVAQKPPLVCLHHSPSSSRLFRNFLPAMGADRIAIALDTPGYGNSDAPPHSVDLEGYARAIAVAIEALPLQRAAGGVDLLGFLTGAQIAGTLALLQPELVRRVILVHPLILPRAERDAFRLEVEKSLDDEWTNHGARLYVRRLEKMLGDLKPADDINAAVVDFIDETIPGLNRFQGGIAALSYPALERFADIRQPTLALILGEERVAQARTGAESLPNIEVHLCLDLTKAAFIDDPEWLARKVRAFLDDTPAPL